MAQWETPISSRRMASEVDLWPTHMHTAHSHAHTQYTPNTYTHIYLCIIYIFMCTHTHHKHTNHKNIHVLTYTHMYTHTHIHMYTHLHTYACIIYTNHKYIHTNHAHTYTWTYTYTHIHASLKGRTIWSESSQFTGHTLAAFGSSELPGVKSLFSPKAVFYFSNGILHAKMLWVLSQSIIKCIRQGWIDWVKQRLGLKLTCFDFRHWPFICVASSRSCWR